MAARLAMVIFHNFNDFSAYSAFEIWREINPTWMLHKLNKRRVFMEKLGKALAFIKRKERVHTEASAAVVKAVQGGS